MRRITLDTNVYVSALNYGGPPLQVLQMAVDGNVQIAISGSIMTELVRVLREKFEWSEDKLAEAQALLRVYTDAIEPSQVLCVIEDDPTDNRVLECAVESKSEYIVTGDKHLLRLKQYEISGSSRQQSSMPWNDQRIRYSSG